MNHMLKNFRWTYLMKFISNSRSFKYPKAGEDNSTVNIYLYDLTNKEKRLFIQKRIMNTP